MKVEGCVRIDGGTIAEVREFLSKFPDICRVSVVNGCIVVCVNYTVG